MVHFFELDDIASCRHKSNNWTSYATAENGMGAWRFLKVLLTFFATSQPCTNLKTRWSSEAKVETITEGHVHYMNLTAFREPETCLKWPSAVKDFSRILRIHSSKSTVLPLPVGADITKLSSERKTSAKLSLWTALKYLYEAEALFKLQECLYWLYK
jgi:hypothetical protein